MQIVPLQPVPSQSLMVTLGGQLCQVDVYQKVYGLFMNVWVNNGLVVAGVLCENLNLIVRSAYLGFIGDFAWIDNQGTSDPTYTGVGSRFSLAYLSASERASINAA